MNKSRTLQSIEILKTELAAVQKEKARLQEDIRKFRCTCYCKVHGPVCGGQEATCREIVKCDRCAIIDTINSARARVSVVRSGDR